MKPLQPFFMALFGTFVEYYDYALYGFSAPFLAQHFFPKEDPVVALLQTYGIFIAGSCAKPLGSLLFGYLGDNRGRAFALKISICGIALPTFLIGLLPDFSQIGYLAPIGLLLCRILQGIFVSGESDTARVFLYEMLPTQYRCLSNSMAYFICMIGIYAASLVGPAFASNPPPADPMCYYWRIPFLFGGVLGLLLFLLRRNLQESELFLATQASQHSDLQSEITVQAEYRAISVFPNPVFKIKMTLFQSLSRFFNFSKNKRPIFITLLLTGAAGGQYHFYFVFLNQYLNQVLKQCDARTAALTTSNLLLCFALLLPFAGLLADRLTQHHKFDLHTLLKRGTSFVLILALVNILYVCQGDLPFGVMLLTVIGLSFTQANTFVVILKQFEISDRCRGVSIGHSLGSMLLSGSAPLISLALWKFTHWTAAPLVYFLLLSCLSYVALAMLEYKKMVTENRDFDNSKTQVPNALRLRRG